MKNKKSFSSTVNRSKRLSEPPRRKGRFGALTCGDAPSVGAQSSASCETDAGGWNISLLLCAAAAAAAARQQQWGRRAEPLPFNLRGPVTSRAWPPQVHSRGNSSRCKIKKERKQKKKEVISVFFKRDF